VSISSSGKEQIAGLIEDMFDRLALDLLGNIPKLQGKKALVFSSRRNYGLANLFVQAMQNKQPTELEKDVLKGFLDSAHGYIESLKGSTKSNVTERVDAIVRESKMRGERPTEAQINAILEEEFSKAKSKMIAIAEAEATKMRNMGTMTDISRMASQVDDSDPNVFFVVVRDGSTCKECIRLHLMPDASTPRIWKLSELKQGYHKRSENVPSVFGLHPHCRCTLTYLSKGFAFKDGRLTYVSENHDERARQHSLKRSK
jgi:hypothetical protein